MTAERWVVVAGWANASDTALGPFPDSATAIQWAAEHLDVDDACERWDAVLLSPAGVEVDQPAPKSMSVIEHAARAMGLAKDLDGVTWDVFERDSALLSIAHSLAAIAWSVTRSGVIASVEVGP